MKRATMLSLSAAMLWMTGCAGMKPSGPATMAGVALHGHVIGGQQPVTGATLALYAAGTTGYASTNTNILTSTVTTDGNGGFNIGGLYSCTAGQQMYMVATGGNPGVGGTNAQLALMAALGDCANLGPTTNIEINEVTTVASVFALAPFMSGYASIGTSATNTAGLARAFNSVNKLVNVSTGYAGGPALASGAVAPLAEINTLANVLASCVNSTGGVAGDGMTTCGMLFSYATPTSGTAPTDTIGLALMMAQNPTLNVSSIYGYNMPTAPFQPTLSVAPTDFTMSISYPGFGTPTSTTVDANGQVWVANSAGNSVTVLSQSGSPVWTQANTNGLSAPVAVAIDATGNGWVADSGGSVVSAFTNSGGVYGSSPFTVGTGPVALAFDTSGDVWVANSGSNNVSELSSTGTLLQTVAGGVSAPGGIAINPK